MYVPGDYTTSSVLTLTWTWLFFLILSLVLRHRSATSQKVSQEPEPEPLLQKGSCLGRLCPGCVCFLLRDWCMSCWRSFNFFIQGQSSTPPKRFISCVLPITFARLYPFPGAFYLMVNLRLQCQKIFAWWNHIVFASKLTHRPVTSWRGPPSRMALSRLCLLFSKDDTHTLPALSGWVYIEHIMAKLLKPQHKIFRF